MLRHVDSADGSRTVLQVTPDTRAHFLKSAFHASMYSDLNPRQKRKHMANQMQAFWYLCFSLLHEIMLPQLTDRKSVV